MRRVLLALLLAATPLGAQSAGKTGAQILQLNAGARASALSGAYTAAHADADVLFYNPAGIADARHGASFAYESYALDIGFGSVAGFTRVGRVSVGASLMYLDEGSIAEILPDPEFGGNTGNPSGNTVNASETAARLSFGLPLRGGRLRLGASLGYVASGIAELNRNAPVADFGAQIDIAAMTFGAAVRNIGGSMSGESSDPLPTELRLGAMVPLLGGSGIGVNVFADAISRLREGSISVAGGVETGLMPRSAGDIGAVARIGYDMETGQLGSLRLGAGLSLRAVSFDYAYQNLDLAGAVHRFGLRWTAR